MNAGPASELTTSAVIRQRLVGLVVLLTAVFLLSMLLRGLGGPRAVDEEGLQTVVVPLGARSELPVVAANPVEERATPAPAAGVIDPAPEAGPDPTGPAPAAPMQMPETVAPRPVAPVPAQKKSETATASRAPKTPPPQAVARWYVVLGSFSDAGNAKALALRARRAGVPAESQPQRVSGALRVRVRAGPFKSEREAQAARASLIVEGMTSARVSKEP